MRSLKIVAAALLIAAATLTAQGWGPDVRLTNDPAKSYTSYNEAWCIAASGNNIHAVWYDNRDGNWEICYKRSTDNGATWGSDTRLTNEASADSLPSVAVSGNTIHVVWHSNRDGNPEIYYKRSTDNGTTWGADTRLSNASGNSRYPSVAVSGDNIHVVWADNRDGGNWEIYYKRSTDGGVTWGPDTRLIHDGAISNFPSIAVSGSNIHVVWDDRRNGGTGEIYYKRSTDNGSTWGSDTRLTNDPAWSRYSSIAVDGDNIHVVWDDARHDYYHAEIYYKRSTDNGTTWEPDKRLTNDPANSQLTSPVVSGNNIHVVWNDNRDGNWEIYYKQSIDNGATWGSDERLTYADGSSNRPSVAIAGNNIHVVWMDRRDGGNSEIYYKRYFDKPNIAPLAAVTGTSLNPGGGRDVDKLNDEYFPPPGTFYGFWESAYTTGQPGDVWMQYEWDRPYKLETSIFYCHPSTPPHLNLPIEYKVEAWIDGKWQEIAYIVNTDSTKAVFADNLGGVVTTKVRINLIDVRDTQGWSRDVATISEWEIYGDTVPQLIEATVDFDPNKLNFKSKGKWVTCYIELEEGYSVQDIDESTVAITEIDGTELDPPLYCEGPFAIGDYNENGITDLMVKFDRQALIAILQDMGYDDGEEVELSVTGELTTGKTFEGSDSIEVLNKGKGKGGGQSDDFADAFSFEPVSPNPFREQTSIQYTLPQSSHVQLVIYDALGRQVKTLVDASQDAGAHTLIWDGCDDAGKQLSSGIYFLKFEAGEFSHKARLVILR